MPKGVRKIPIMPIDRFNKKYIINPETECWEWQDCLNEWGYGQLKVDYKTILAHRFSYQFYKGDLGVNLLVCHICDNPKCVNPEHLYLGTASDNMQDMVKRKRNKQRAHPSFQAYSKGCRCNECCKIHTDYLREWRRSKKAKEKLKD